LSSAFAFSLLKPSYLFNMSFFYLAIHIRCTLADLLHLTGPCRRSKRNPAYKDGHLNMKQALPQIRRGEPIKVSSELRGLVWVLAALLLAALLVACIPAFGRAPQQIPRQQRLGYNRTLDSHCFSPRTDISAKNVGDLRNV
jgi:hypothetical protein